MKKIVVLVLSLFMICLGFSCKRQQEDSGTLSYGSDGVTSSSALQLLKRGFKKSRGNLVVSGISVDFVTCMIANGATGTSLNELESFMGKSTGAKTRELQSKLSSISGSSALDMSNAIWGNYFQEEYKSNMKNKLNVYVQALPNNTRMINNWVAAKTHDKIQNLLEEQATDRYSSYLVNTIFFKDSWKFEFDKSETTNDDFSLMSGSKIKVPMMHQTTNVGYAESNGIQSIELPYRGGGTMRIYLPKEGTSFSSFVQKLSQNVLNMDYETEKVEISLPKFEIQSDIDIKSIFQSLGISKIFESSNQDLGNMVKTNGYIEDIKQKAVITVDEEGTEAAAATVAATARGLFAPQVIEFRADRPFVFYVSEGDFIGVYVGR